ncbi:hypothetical protein K432DRAFT_409567 [Lepidopterella palustris CBS 459.81]|uniref:Uncharacterized protein n=1 Tax=Lepidopterella palustris CBS 459.81 TaxID=1314670 RepID=A0A8E2DZV4_9PEZI|nr:hypothetical protein K432DRAFT_409567 [Lepidopterella palustris CBS 459.81]
MRQSKLLARPRSAYAYTEQKVVAEEIDVPSLKQHSITLATAVRAAWGFLFAEMSGQQDVTFGDIVARRSLLAARIEELDTQICTSVLAIRVQLRSMSSVLDLLRDVQYRQIAIMLFESLGATFIIGDCTS